MIPDHFGTWHYKPLGIDVDVYELPTGHLCVWFEDVEIPNIDHTWWTDEQWVGHIPVKIFDSDPNNWEAVIPALSPCCPPENRRISKPL